MTTKEIQLAFWTELKQSNPTLFKGTPHKGQYFDITSSKTAIKIRLNIYLDPADYVTKGVQSIALVVPANKNKEINDLFLAGGDCISLKNDCVINRVANSSLRIPVNEDDKKWQPYIDWFTKYTKKLQELLNSWK